MDGRGKEGETMRSGWYTDTGCVRCQQGRYIRCVSIYCRDRCQWVLDRILQLLHCFINMRTRLPLHHILQQYQKFISNVTWDNIVRQETTVRL
jgi:hypothetical protein